MLHDGTQNLIATARNPSSTKAMIEAAAQSFFDAAGSASVEEANLALSALASCFHLDDLPRAGFVALVCGALVERGCDPQTIAQPLTDRIGSLLDLAAGMANACRAAIGPVQDGKQDEGEQFENARKQIAVKMPLENAAWQALRQFWCPAIAVYSASATARANAQHLRAKAAQIAECHEAGHWLGLMLSVLDNEPILVIEPQTSLGILARISGVVDNFQLNVLLMDAFPRNSKAAPPRVPSRVADVARGTGPQQTDDTVTGVWNLYSWQAVQPGGKLPDTKDYGAKGTWIWNEGVPGDIPVFEGRRVILLGPPSYSRSWRSQRMFAGLPAKFECEHQLAKGEVDDWLRRMAAAKAAC